MEKMKGGGGRDGQKKARVWERNNQNTLHVCTYSMKELRVWQSCLSELVSECLKSIMLFAVSMYLF